MKVWEGEHLRAGPVRSEHPDPDPYLYRVETPAPVVPVLTLVVPVTVVTVVEEAPGSPLLPVE